MPLYVLHWRSQSTGMSGVSAPVTMSEERARAEVERQLRRYPPLCVWFEEVDSGTSSIERWWKTTEEET